MPRTATRKIGFSLLVITLSILLISACSSSTDSFFKEFPSGESSASEEEIHVFDQNSNVIIIEEVVIGLLLIAVIVGIITRRLRVPYTVGLVLIGLALSLRGQSEVDFPPELFLALLVPPLVFEAAFHLAP